MGMEYVEEIDLLELDAEKYANFFPRFRHVVRFSDWGEFLQTADSAVPAKPFKRKSRDVTNITTDPWYGTATFDDAITLARYGWAEGAALVNKFTGELFDDVSSLVIKPNLVYRDSFGMGVDVARYIEGEPECWFDYDEEVVEGYGRNIIRLVYNCSASAAISPRVMMAKGAAVAALVALMEYSGRGVQVDIVDSFAEGREGIEVYATVKQADEDLDVLTVAYAIAHPATARRLMFSIGELFDEEIRQQCGIYADGAYGQPTEAHDQGDIYISSSTYGDVKWRDEESAMRWVIKTLKEQGVALKSDDQGGL